MRVWTLFFLTIFAMALALPALADYKPKEGETVLKLSLEGKDPVFILLHTKRAPKTTAHIIELTEKKFYDGQRFHRVVKTPEPFLVAIGDPQSKTKPMNDPAMGTGGSNAKIPYEETGFPADEGSVGLSTPLGDRQFGDSQFHILLGKFDFLNDSYTIFGKVVDGMNVVKQIALGDKVTKAEILRG